MAGIADQLKLWAKGRKLPKGKTPEGKEDEKGMPPKGGSEPPEADEKSDAGKGPTPPFAKETTPGKPVGKEGKPNPFEKGKKPNPFAAFAKGKK